MNGNKSPDSLKLSDIVSVFKNFDPTDKTIFRSIDVLALLSKVFEKIMYDQLYEYAENEYVVFVKLTLRSMHFSDLFRNGRKC